jgi:hypothetical protein
LSLCQRRFNADFRSRRVFVKRIVLVGISNAGGSHTVFYASTLPATVAAAGQRIEAPAHAPVCVARGSDRRE